MYEKYTTSAIVLASRERGEHDRTYALYTSDFGLVYARASAVRRMESRMRSALGLFSYATVSLVRGTRGWRVTGARAEHSAALSAEAAHAYARITQLLMRLVRGEERNPYLFEVLTNARTAFPAAHSLPAAELLCVARVLYALGYLSPKALTAALFTHAAYADEDLGMVSAEQKDMLASVNSALAESQL